MIIKILGTGCSNCKKLEANAKEAVSKTGVSAKVAKVENIKDIMAYGVMRTPAIVINEKVKAFGKVCTVDEIVKFINEEK
ncbi:small redox-active disulfide protein 2 [Caloramator quimbayensis]|uniref:Small redox-active disulfide protein 2 n=1 Tax=Caloramator quimbayensis TaxID=1147123 RepID=A0A1T4WV88_9CLOT|nr:thioredoxin family protein [Caloramator quimbayensis]SKA81290.1 small redox-active disulfide protein 2 [Caloramator quimbayensis]